MTDSLMIACPTCGADPGVPCTKPRGLNTMHVTRTTAAEAPTEPLPLAPDAVDRALRAHWPSYDRMRPDLQREWRAKMEAALRAALTR